MLGLRLHEHLNHFVQQSSLQYLQFSVPSSGHDPADIGLVVLHDRAAPYQDFGSWYYRAEF